MRRLISLGSFAALALFGVSAAAAQTVTELYVTPDTIRLTPGGRKALAVQAFDDAGNAVLSFSFKSSDTTIALVAANGSVSAAGKGGRATVTVQAGNKTQLVPVIVTGPGSSTVATAPKPAATPPAPKPAPATPAKTGVARIVAEPVSLTLFPGQSGTVVIRAFDASGAAIDTPRLTWRSLQPALFSVNPTTGTISAIAAGEGTVNVLSSTGATVSIPVTVSALSDYRLSVERLVMSPDQRQTIGATLSQQGNSAVPAGALQWSAADPGVISVDANGEVLALAAGQTDVIVRGLGMERRIPVIVHSKVAHFLVAPRLDQPVRMNLQATRQFTAMPQTADSIPIEGVPTTWALSDSTVASFDAESGVLAARKGGTTTLSFTVRGFQPKSWTVEVLPGDVQLTATRASLRPAEQLQLAASFVDPRGTVVAPATGVLWTTSDATIAKISGSGMLQGVAPGRATITGLVTGGKPSSISVIVTGDLLVSSTRGGSTGIYALAAGAPEQFHPVIADSGNNVDASYSPDRARLVFASDRAGTLDLYVADADGRNSVRLTSDPAPESEPAWSPDGRRIIFAATRAGSRQLYVISVDGGEARQLTSLPGGASQPVVSPDGRTVAFTGAASPSRDPVTDIYTIPLQGGAPTPVTQTRERRESEPAYLPDGSLAWLQLRKDKKDPDMVVQQPRIGGISATLLSTPLALQSFAVSRDGERIAWVGTRVVEGSKAAPELTLQWRPVAGGSETTIRLQPGERITSPAF